MKLKDWFIEKDYGLCLAILGEYCKNRILLQNLSRKKNPAKLEYELKKIAGEKGIDLTAEPVDQDPELTGGKVISMTHATGENDKDKQAPAGETPPAGDQSHSDQVIDQMNADKDLGDKLDKLEEGAQEIVSDKLSDLEYDADDIVSDSVNDLKTSAQNIVSETIADFEAQVQEIMSGKLEVIRDGRKVKYEDLSLEMKARWDQNRDAYKEIRALHEKLKLMENATPEDRQPLTERICTLDEMIRDNWTAIDAWKPAPAGEKAPEIDHKRINANRKFISTNVKKVAEQTDPVKRAKIVAALQERADELVKAGETLAPETLEELKKSGINC